MVLISWSINLIKKMIFFYMCVKIIKIIALKIKNCRWHTQNKCTIEKFGALKIFLPSQKHCPCEKEKVIYILL